MLAIKNSLYAISIVITLLPLVASAESLSSITETNSEIAQAQAKLKLILIQADIAKKELELKDSSYKSGTSLIPPNLNLPLPMQVPPIPHTSNPFSVQPRDPLVQSTLYVSAIEGYDGVMSAYIAYGNGKPFKIHVNDVLNEGWTVSSIKASKIDLTRSTSSKIKIKSQFSNKTTTESMSVPFGVIAPL